MFELETEVRRWRRNLERRSSLSMREVDELEDHLRARFELELEVTPAQSPARAFSTVCDELGEAAALSKEFAKAGWRRWRSLLLAGWGMFAASFFLPISRTVWVEVGSLNPDLLASGRAYEYLWTLITMGIVAGDVVATVWVTVWASVAVLLPNLPMLMTLPALWGSRQPGGRWLPRILGAMGVAHLGLAVTLVFRPSPFPYVEGAVAFQNAGPGFWLWSASFVLAAAALWLRRRGWTSARPKIADNLAWKSGVS